LDLIRRLFHLLTDVEGMIRWGGYAGLAAIVFAETGLMVGFFLPGDSLLVAAGLFAGRGDLELFGLWALLVPMAITGNSTGFAIGRRVGKALFARPSSRWFKRRHLIRTQLFYEQHGGKAVVIAQFLPILRTFTPVVAGIARMGYRRFAAFNVVGAAAWVVSMTLTGYALGKTFPGIAKRIELIMLVVIAVSFLPAVVSSWRAARAKRAGRLSFLGAMGDLVGALGGSHWDSSPEGLRRLAAELPAPNGAAVIEDDAVELVAAESPPLAELSEAGGEVAGWHMDERFAQARAVLSEAYGEPRESALPATADGLPQAPPTRIATWELPAGSLTLAQRCGSCHRLTVRVEPATSQAVSATAAVPAR